MTETAVKYFTVADANATLPYVRRIVEDIVGEYKNWRDCIFRYEMIAAASTSEEGESNEQLQLREEVDEIAQRINAFIEELSAVGCIFKGFEGGLVDFHSRLGDRDVFLCWKLGEPEVQYWHEVDSGFAGRQSLVPELMHEERDQ